MSTSLKDFSFLHDISGDSFNTSRSNGWFQDVFEVRQHRVARCEEGKNFTLSRFVVMLTSVQRIVLKSRRLFFNDIVEVASSPKARFELGDIVIG